MEYIGIAVLVVFILYQVIGKKLFSKALMNKMVERIAEPSLKYPSDSKEEIVIAMYFYYACLIFTCQKRNFSKLTRTVVDMAFRKTITDVFNYKELPEEEYMKKLKHVFNIIGFLDKYPHPEVLQDLLSNIKKKANSVNGLNLSFDTVDTYTKACDFYVKRVGNTVDFLIETNKHYPD